jgi:hypothetical protein
VSTPPLVPPLFTGLVDDAAVFPPGSATLTDAVAEHRTHRAAWYADLVGPLLVPATEVGRVTGPLTVAVIGDAGIDGLATTVDKVSAAGLTVAQVEVPVAKRGEDPQPGLARLRQLAGELRVYAEIPLTWGLLGALDTVAEARAAGLRLAPKFRTGGLAAELFPTPVELAAVICACRDRQLPFKLTAGLHHAVRHTDPETGFTHHGFLNVLAGTLLAAEGAEVAAVAELLGATHPLPLVEAARVHRLDERPLWVGFGSCSVVEPLADLVRLGLVNGGAE